jgi:Adaptor complexes medium subunit family
MAVTNAVSWRSEGLKYRKNEVFLDVVESVNLLVNAEGNVVRSEILGAIKMKCYLTGMPDVRLGLNDKLMFESTGRTATKGKAVEMEDVKFHQCVRLSRFENDRTISFIPPDGEFELMSYRLNTEVKPVIWTEVVIESHPGSRIEFMIKVLPSNTGQRTIQTPIHRQQCRNFSARPRRCRQSPLQDEHGIRRVRPRKERIHLENQAVPRWQRLFMSGAFRASQCQE